MVSWDGDGDVWAHGRALCVFGGCGVLLSAFLFARGVQVLRGRKRTCCGRRWTYLGGRMCLVEGAVDVIVWCWLAPLRDGWDLILTATPALSYSVVSGWSGGGRRGFHSPCVACYPSILYGAWR